MTTTAQHQQQQQGRQHLGFVVDNYDPDDVVPRDSPPMTAIRPSLVPSPSPSPDIPQAQVSLDPTAVSGCDKANRHKVRPSSGDSVLLSYLGNGRNPEISRTASRQALASCNEESLIDEPEPEPEPEPKAPAAGAGMLGSSLQHLAAGALLLQVCDATPPAAATPTAGPRAPTAPSAPSAPAAPTPTRDATSVSDISDPTHRLSIRDDVPATTFSPREPYIFPEPKHDATSPPTGLPTPATGPLPPIVDSPRSESNGQVLPSIRSQLGDFGRLSTDHLASDKDPARHGQFPRSPPANMHRFSLGVSPPVSPNDGFPRNLPSPRSLGSSPYFYTNGMQQPQQRHSNADFANHTPAETPSTDQSGSTPATSTSTSVAERMSIDGLTNPVGNYVCTFAGCTAAPFQTQYLLNSHANVHSSARPHYCPVQGCPRSEGGRGFKRKNEMIRHGLVHDSPGYVCPFCPDREHKYPRPDNLQRHVRVHHVDKDKDDPLLREVLSQRPDGLNRNRRRRGAPP